MEQDKLYEVLSGMVAYDTGCTDSGMKNEVLRQQVICYLESLNDEKFRIIMSRFIREYFVSEKAIEDGYGIEDITEFIRWLDKFMHIQL